MAGIELPEPERRKTGRVDDRDRDRDQQIRGILDIVGHLADTVRKLDQRVARLAKELADRDKTARHQATEEQETPEPAPWVWYTPPAAPEDDPAVDGDPRTTVENFVTWYNATYTGFEGGRSKLIPDCWRQHPGLAMEIATLAYSWRAPNIGASASARDAQYWHNTIRPGFADRLLKDWVMSDCLDGQHRDGGGQLRPDRFAVAEPASAAPAAVESGGGKRMHRQDGTP